MRIVALQTARECSKSVIDKNMYPYNGKPLYEHNISHAQNCKLINDVYITTDCQRIIDAKKAKIIRRPAFLCKDTSSHYNTIIHGLNKIEADTGKVDILIVLLGNTPHAYTEDLTMAILNFTKSENFDKFDSCMSVAKYPMFNPYRSFEKLTNGNIVSIVDHKATNRQNVNDKNAFNDTYFFTGSFWIIKRETLIKNNGKSVFSWLGNRIMPFEQIPLYQELDASWQINLLK